MAYKHRFNTKLRDTTWSLETLAAYKAGRGRLPICVHCDGAVHPDEAWDVSHVGKPRAFGGKEVGVGHRLCNQRDNNEVVTPMVAKAERVRKRHLGITGAGLGKCPMKAGRRSAVSKTMQHGVRPRLTQGQKLAATLARRHFKDFTPEGDAR